MTCKFSANVISITQACGYLVLFVFSAITLSWGNELRLPGTGLDPSWQEALVQATDQHLVFGKDIIFSYGPFHQIYTSQISENLGPLLIGRLLYGVACGAALLLISKPFNVEFWICACRIYGTMHQYLTRCNLLCAAANPFTVDHN